MSSDRNWPRATAFTICPITEPAVGTTFRSAAAWLHSNKRSDVYRLSEENEFIQNPASSISSAHSQSLSVSRDLLLISLLIQLQHEKMASPHDSQKGLRRIIPYQRKSSAPSSSHSETILSKILAATVQLRSGSCTEADNSHSWHNYPHGDFTGASSRNTRTSCENCPLWPFSAS